MKFPFSFRAKTPADKLPEQSSAQKPNTETAADATTVSPQAILVSQPVQNAEAGATAKATPADLPAAQAPRLASGAAQITSAPTDLPATTVAGQMDSMVMSAEDIIAAYKIFLKRVPESMEVVTPRVGLSAERVLFDFMSSSEFTNRPEVANLVFAVGKKILDERAAKNPAPAPTDAPTVSADQTPTPTPTTDTNPKSS